MEEFEPIFDTEFVADLIFRTNSNIAVSFGYDHTIFFGATTPGGERFVKIRYNEIEPIDRLDFEPLGLYSSQVDGLCRLIFNERITNQNISPCIMEMDRFSAVDTVMTALDVFARAIFYLDKQKMQKIADWLAAGGAERFVEPDIDVLNSLIRIYESRNESTPRTQYTRLLALARELQKTLGRKVEFMFLLNLFNDVAAFPATSNFYYVMDNLLLMVRQTMEDYFHPTLFCISSKVGSITFDHFIDKYIETPVSLPLFKSLIFMVLYTLHCIRVLYPRFEHYDLHTSNVLLVIDNSFVFDPRRFSYLNFGDKYFVPYFGVLPKLIDFEYSVIPELKIFSDKQATKNLFRDKMREGSDEEFFLSDILNEFGVGYVESDDDSATVKFVRALLQDAHLDKDKVLRNSVWDEYLQEQTQIYAEFKRPAFYETPRAAELEKSIQQSREVRLDIWRRTKKGLEVDL